MSRKIILVFLLLSGWILLNGSSYVTLEESIDIAIEHNFELKGERSAIDAARWQSRSVLGNLLPEVSFNASMVRIDDDTYQQANEIFKLPVFGTNNLPTGDYVPLSLGGMNGLYKTSYRTGITVTQPIFVGGKIALGYQITRYGRMQAENSYLERKSDLRLNIASSYLTILKLQDMRELIRKSIEGAEANRDKAALQKELGLARRTDYLQWLVRLEEYNRADRELSNNLEMLLETFNHLLGMESILYFPEEIALESYTSRVEELKEMSEQDIERFLDRQVSGLYESNPTLRNLELSRKMLAKNRRMAQGNFLPTISVQYSYEFENDDKLNLSGDNNWNIAAVLSLPLFRGGSNYAELQKSRSELRRIEYLNRTLNDYYARETRRLTRELINRAKNIKSAETAYDLTRENYNILNTLFEQNMLTGSDLLDAEALLLNSEIERISTYYDFILTNYELEKYTARQEVK